MLLRSSHKPGDSVSGNTQHVRQEGRESVNLGNARLPTPDYPTESARSVSLSSDLSKEAIDPRRLEKAIHFLYEADGLLKSGSEPQLILENVLLSLCAR